MTEGENDIPNMKRAIQSIVVTLAVMLPLLVLSVPTASADFIEQWAYTGRAGFIDFTPGSVDALLPGSLLGLPTRLEWGVPANTEGLRSALQVTGPVSGVVITNGPAVPDVTITHEDRGIAQETQIPDLGALTGATILAHLELTPLVPPASALPPFSVPFHIAFHETFNTTPCAFPSASVCDDVFVLLNPTSQSLSFLGPQGINYTITQNVAGLGPLPAGACSEAGLPSGCVGVATQEGLNSVALTSFMITAAVIPEPSTLLLLGSGLAALSLYARKRVKGQA